MALYKGKKEDYNHIYNLLCDGIEKAIGGIITNEKFLYVDNINDIALYKIDFIVEKEDYFQLCMRAPTPVIVGLKPILAPKLKPVKIDEVLVKIQKIIWQNIETLSLIMKKFGNYSLKQLEVY